MPRDKKETLYMVNQILNITRASFFKIHTEITKKRMEALD